MADNKTILICGGAGYIGSHAAKLASAAGYKVVVVDDLSRGKRAAVQWGPLEVGDIGDSAFMADIFARHKPLAVMQFAALIEVGASMAEPARYYEANLVKTLRLFDCMLDAGVDKLIFSSTAAVYGLPAEDGVLTENSPTQPINPYGHSKLAVEYALATCPKYLAGIRYTVLRYFNAAGADPDGRTGQMNLPGSHLIPRAVAATMGLSDPLQVFGDDYATPDGTCIRDYVHVSDLAAAHVAALQRLERGGASLTCNLGTRTGTSVREILVEVERAMGKPVPHTIAPRRAGDPPLLVADNARAKAELGWQPTIALPEIVRTAVAWQETMRDKPVAG